MFALASNSYFQIAVGPVLSLVGSFLSELLVSLQQEEKYKQPPKEPL